MDKHTLTVLEFERLLELVAGRAQSEPGAVYCRGIKPDLSEDEAQKAWRTIDEAKELLDTDGTPDLGDLVEVGDLLAQLEVEGALLSPPELLLIGRVIRTSRIVKNFIGERSERAPSLCERTGQLPVFKELENKFTRSLAPPGEVLDTASSKLARIRQEKSRLRGSIQTRLTAMMRAPEMERTIQDEYITQRLGRYVIPVRSASVHGSAGVVHDVSSSGATSYLEPLEVVEDNNRFNLMRNEEKREVRRILLDLSTLVATESDLIRSAGRILAEIDSFFARARLSRRYDFRAPIIDSGHGLDLRRALHPLLLARQDDHVREIQAIDLRMEPESRVIIISGINAGGKTVALKTAGLLSLMAQSGQHIPVSEGSILPFFDNILADIGDEQDLESDLSTFSGHIRRLSRILDKATDQSLVLLDELGTGTDPGEGAALALSFLDEFRNRGSWVITATHFHLIKAYAHQTEGVINASVLTDSDGRPIYKLGYGSPGFSAGLSMARKLGLNPELVNRAESYLDEGQKKTQDLLARLEEERAELARAREEYEMLEHELSASLVQARIQKENAEIAQKEELEIIRSKGKETVSRAGIEFKQILKQLRESDSLGGREINEFHAAEKRLMRSLPNLDKGEGTIPDLRAGDFVRSETLGVTGRLVNQKTGLNRAEIEVDGVKISTALTDLSQAGGSPSRKAKKMVFPSATGQFSRPEHEINLIGRTVAEAIPVVDKLLDQAQLSGLKYFYIVHGKGTGRLREAIRDFIRDDARVEGFHPGGQAIGGDGVTVVELFS
ncbi:MAG: Smr/MutS family protein [Candidatus Adiutricales bacterium]